MTEWHCDDENCPTCSNLIPTPDCPNEDPFCGVCEVQPDD